MTTEISSANQQFLDAAIARGVFPSRDAAIDQAVSLLRERQEAIDRIRANPISVPELPDVLERQADGSIAIRGHRIGLHLILERYFAGTTEAELEDWFSSVPLDALKLIVAFVKANASLMREYLDRQATLEELLYGGLPRGPTVEELRSRWHRKFGRPFESACR